MKLGLISLGCSKNLVDSEHMLGSLVARKGFTITNDVSDAEVVIVNTCGFIGDAKEESVQTILEIGQYKNTGKLKKLLVAGCLAQRYAEELMAELPEIDAIIGTGEIDKIEEVIDDVLDGSRVIRSESLDYLASSSTERILTTKPHTAYIKIAEGCDRKCTYCIIPKLRGPLRSRSLEDIYEETKILAKAGVRELNVLAQETTEYGIDLYGEKSLAKALKEMARVEGIEWIRSYYMFPRSVTTDLIETIRDEEKICNYFDIPIQHIADSQLKAMGRAITGAETRAILEEIRTKVPDATIRTTIIVGFPGESEADFNELKEFIKEFKFDYVGVFKYSQEEDTPAYLMNNQIDEDTKIARWNELVELQKVIAEDKNAELVGKTIEVMIDGVSEESEYMLEGRSRGQALEIDGKILTNDGEGKPGEIVKVKIEKNFEYDFLGPIVENESK